MLGWRGDERKGLQHPARTQLFCPLHFSSHLISFPSPFQLAIPLPAPADGSAALTGTYKVQLAFDGDRLVTPWLAVLGREGGGVPVINLLFSSAGGAPTRVVASVAPAPPAYLAAHGALAAEWADPGVWPKHVPVSVAWAPPAPAVDRRAGAGVVLWGGLAAAVAALVAALAGKEKLVADLMEDVAGVIQGGGGWEAGGMPLPVGGGVPLAHLHSHVAAQAPPPPPLPHVAAAVPMPPAYGGAPRPPCTGLRRLGWQRWRRPLGSSRRRRLRTSSTARRRRHRPCGARRPPKRIESVCACFFVDEKT